MFSYKQIIQLSNMFIEMDDPYLTPCSLYDHIDLTDDLPWNYTLMNFPTSEFLMGGCDQFDLITTSTYDRPISPRSLIRHHDCMWSGRCTTHPDKFQCNYMKQKMDLHYKKLSTTEPVTAATPASGLVPAVTQTATMKKLDQESIPAGRSLLINSRLNQSKPTTVLKLPTVTTNDFLKEREFIARPDTPLSLDDDPPVFKHTIDLAACTMGSNKMSLITDNDGPTEIINMLKEHLEDHSSGNLQIRNKLNAFLPNTSNSESLTDLMKDIKSLSDFEGIGDDDDDDDDDDVDDDDSADEIDSDSESITNNTNNNSNNSNNVNSLSSKSSQSRSTISDFQQTMHSDHSYTRSKSRVDVVGLGVQTPSDSEEEIDVVSIGEKTLPTNPTERDRRALQTTVAHKISARIVKTSAGIRTIPPRRQYYDESESSCSVTPTKSSAQKHSYHNISCSQSSTHTDGSQPPTQQQQQQQTSSRKRPNSSGRDDRTSNAKRHKGKKQRSAARRRNSDSDETDTIEKRNQHNDMERQRRIGLKNLFEELKKQLPNLKDKERAPKVNILREATNLCRKFNREEDEKAALKKRQAKLYHRVSVLRTSLAAQRSRYLD